MHEYYIQFSESLCMNLLHDVNGYSFLKCLIQSHGCRETRKSFATKLLATSDQKNSSSNACMIFKVTESVVASTRKLRPITALKNGEVTKIQRVNVLIGKKYKRVRNQQRCILYALSVHSCHVQTGPFFVLCRKPTRGPHRHFQHLA